MSRVKVEITGLAELRSKLKDPSRIQHPLYMLLKDATNIGKKTAWEAIDGGAGIAVRSISARIDPTSALIYTMLPQARALSIEEGRQPGIRPQSILGSIIRWVQSMRIRKTGIEVAVEIHDKGAKGKHYMAAAAEKVRGEMPRLVAEMAERLKGEFARK